MHIKSALVAAILLLAPTIAAAEPVSFTDLAGRHVELEKPASTIVVGDGRVLSAIALLDRENPVERVAAVLSDLKRYDPDLLAALQDKFPAARTMPIYSGNSLSASAEKIIQLAPDAAVFGLSDHGPGSNSTELIAQLDASGVAVVFVDFRQDPLANTVPSLEVLGQLLGREKEAGEYLDFYNGKKAAIAERVAGLSGEQPSVFLQAHVGRFPCCVSMANGMLGPFIEFAGGRNIASAVAPGVTGRHTQEFLIAENPDVWIGTASGTPRDIEHGQPFIVLGSQVDPATARQSLSAAIEHAGIDALAAVENKRAYGLLHHFYNSPLNIYALEAFAKWIHPDEFGDVDPDATLAEIYERFLPFDLTGTYSVGLD